MTLYGCFFTLLLILAMGKSVAFRAEPDNIKMVLGGITIMVVCLQFCLFTAPITVDRRFQIT